MSELWFETAIVLAVGVLPDLLRSMWMLYWKSQAPESFLRSLNYTKLDAFAGSTPYVQIIVRSLQVCSVVLYLIWRGREQWNAFGLQRPKWVKDTLLAAAMVLACCIVYITSYLVGRAAWDVFTHGGAGESAAQSVVRPSDLYPSPTGIAATVVVIIACFANGFAEELVLRAYLLPRFERLLGSTWVSLLVTTGLFASYHMYQGVLGVLNATIVGLVFGAVFCWLRRIWPLALAHATADLVGSMITRT